MRSYMGRKVDSLWQVLQLQHSPLGQSSDCLTDRDSLVYYCDKLGFGALETPTISGVCGENFLYNSGLRLLILLDGNVIVDACY
jgi:hypothetical protein